MRVIRRKVFETNSSSTHSLSHCGKQNNYVSKSDKIVIDFIDTHDEYCLSTLKEKVSYLVSHIINNYKRDCLDYEDLIEQVSRSYDFKKIQDYVQEKYKKTIVFPKKYDGDIDEIVNINHQLQETNFDMVLRDICARERDYLEEILADDKAILIDFD